MKKLSLIAFLILCLFLLTPAWDDEDLLSAGTTSVFLKPNIMFLLDNSGSMSQYIIPDGYYKDPTSGLMVYDAARDLGYDPDADYGGDVSSLNLFLEQNEYYFVDDDQGLRCSTHGYWDGSDWVQPYLSGTWHDDEDTGISEVGSLTLNGKTIYLFVEGYGDPPVTPSPNRIYGKLLKYLFFVASQDKIDLWNHFMLYGKTDTDDYVRDDSTKVRIRVAASAMEEILTLIDADYQAEKSEYGTEVVDHYHVGITYFNPNTSGDDAQLDQGGDIEIRCHDNASVTTLLGAVDGADFYPSTNTPLAEALATVYGYFRFSDKLGSINPTSNFEYFLPYDHASAAKLPTNQGEFCIAHWCQMNFAVIVTDGEPTQDSYIVDSYNSDGYDKNAMIFSTDNNGVASWGPPTAENDSSSLLDDISYYMYNNDLFPDSVVQPMMNPDLFAQKAQNKQWVFTYTIGFTIDNNLLKSTAENGGGEYFTANNKEQLVDALKKILGAIDEKVNAYASFAAPKYSFTHGRRGYVATFIPRNEQSMWEGHLNCYLLDDDGNFPADLDDKNATVVVDGSPVKSWQWDAADQLVSTTPANRTIYTEKGGSFITFTTANIDPIDLGINSGDTTQDEADRNTVVNFIRGNYGYDPVIRLGDIFHFNPVVVSAPLKWKAYFEPSYDAFYQHWLNRKEVIYTGSNDGMIHCFDLNTGDELWAYIPASLLTKLKTPALHPVDGDSHEYFVDGKAMVRDVKTGNAGDWTDWKTVLIFGLGVGGKSYCALNVTDPENPVFLWEFSDSTMGYTEARPVIADFATDGTAAFTGVVLSGGLNPTEVPADQVHVDRYQGKSFFILDAYSGARVKEFTYGASVTNTLSGSTYTHTNPGFLYAFTASPLIIDTNSDGFVDKMYMLESGDYRGTTGQGGRIWRVNLDGNPSGWLPTKIYQAEDGQTFFVTPTAGYDEQFHLWIFAGTGHRPFPNDQDNLTGQMIALMDYNLSTLVTNDDMVDITASIETPPEEGEEDKFNLTGKNGIYFDFINMAREMLFEPTPLYLNQILWFNTYAPDETVKDDPCTPPGNQFVYALSISNQGAALAVSEVVVEPGKILGYGALAGGKYKIYLGEGELGSSKITDQKTIDLSDIFGPIFWKEDRD